MPGEYTSRVGAQDKQRAYNLRLGDLQLDLGGRLTLSFDDNTSKTGGSIRQQSAFMLETGLDIGLFYPFSRDVRLDTKIYVGYLQPFGAVDSATSGLIIRATEASAFALDMRVGDNGILSLVDTLSLHVESLDIGSTTEVGDIRLFENDLALQYEHQLSKTERASLRLGRYDLFSLGNELRSRDRYAHYLAGRYDWQAGRDDMYWPYFRYARHVHPLKQHNDADELEVGLGWTREVSRNSRLILALGYQIMAMKIRNVPEAPDKDAGLTGKLVYKGRLNRRFSHSFTAKYQRRIGAYRLVNYTKDWRLSYRINWTMTRRWQSAFYLHWLDSVQSGASGVREDYLVWELQVGYRFNEFLAYAGYSRTNKYRPSNEGYVRNEITLGVIHNF